MPLKRLKSSVDKNTVQQNAKKLKISAITADSAATNKNNINDKVDMPHSKPLTKKPVGNTAVSASSTTTTTTMTTNTNTHSAPSFQLAIPDRTGCPLIVGDGGSGQLGLGEDTLEARRPIKLRHCADESNTTCLKQYDSVVRVCSGGMHTVLLNKQGTVFTFGCNDDFALGRVTEPEKKDADDADKQQENEQDSKKKPDKNGMETDDLNKDEEEQLVAENLPAPITFFERQSIRIAQVSAGDSHTGLLTQHGLVFVCGAFRNSNGLMGLLRKSEKNATPQQIVFPSASAGAVASSVRRSSAASFYNSSSSSTTTGTERGEKGWGRALSIQQIASGQDHLVMLSADGDIYTIGCAEQGQLGRTSKQKSQSGGGRLGMQSQFLTPQICRVHGRPKFSRVWAGYFCTVAQQLGGERAIYACGLNNYWQLGLPAQNHHHQHHQNNSNNSSNSQSQSQTNSVSNSASNSLASKRKVAIGGDSAASKKNQHLFGLSNAEEGDGCVWFLAKLAVLEQLEEYDSNVKQQQQRQQEKKKEKAVCVQDVSIGQHHSMWLDSRGRLFALGRTHYGRLGLGDPKGDAKCNATNPTNSTNQEAAGEEEEKEESASQERHQSRLQRVGGALLDKHVIQVSCGLDFTFAVTQEGGAYSWGRAGMHLSGPAEAEDEDVFEPIPMLGNNLKANRVVELAAGGQHAVLLVQEKKRDDDNEEGEKEKKTSAADKEAGAATTTEAVEKQTNQTADSIAA